MIDLSVDWLLDHFQDIKDTDVLWHPLGFCGATIERGSDYHLKVHYWPKGDRRPKTPNWPIHTHRFELESLVLAGKITDVQYRTDKAGSDWNQYAVEYIGDEKRNSSWTDACKHANLTEISQTTFQAGDKYRVAKGTAHQSVVSETVATLTFVKTWDRSPEGPIVFGNEQGGDFFYERNKFKTELFWSQVRKAISAQELR